MRFKGKVEIGVELDLDDEAAELLRTSLGQDNDSGDDFMSLLRHLMMMSEMRSRMAAETNEEAEGEGPPRGRSEETSGDEPGATRPANGRRKRGPRRRAEGAETPTEE